MSVAAWSRPLHDARALEPHGVRVASTAWEAASEADLVVTMAPDANAIEGFATGERGFLSAKPAAVWAQCATVGLDGCERLSALAAEARRRLRRLAVLGTKEPAERGELVVLASGPDDALDRSEPFFAA